MKLLALETSSNVCSIALMNNQVIIEKHHVLPQQHGQVALDWISALLSEQSLLIDQLDAICYSCGPGGFTGIRISAAIAQGIRCALNTPIIGVPSLQVIAQGIYREYGGQKVMLIQDAKMQQAYCGYYTLNNGMMEPIAPDQLCQYLDIKLPALDEAWWLSTNIEDPSLKALSRAKCFHQVVTHYQPKAYDVLILAQKFLILKSQDPSDLALPVYLYPEESWKKIR